MAGSISRMWWFFRPDCNFYDKFRSIVLSRRFYLRGFIFFFEARFDQLIQDLIYLFLVALSLIAIDIATNRWRGLRAETKTAALLIETAIFLDRAYCNLLWSFDQLLGSGCDSYISIPWLVIIAYYLVEITRSFFFSCLLR